MGHMTINTGEKSELKMVYNNNGNGLKQTGLPKKFLFVSFESLSGDLAWQLKKEGHEVKRKNS